MVHPHVRRRLPVVVVDLDGTLADYGDRNPYDGHLCATDALVTPVADVLAACHDTLNWRTVILSGRNEGARAETEAWLRRNDVAWDALYLRAVDDWRPARVYKQGLIEQMWPRYDVRLVLEDDPTVAETVRALGYPCWLVDEWRAYEPKETG